MTITDAIAFLGAASACILALITLIRERGTLAAWLFSFGMVLAGAEAFLGVLALHIPAEEGFIGLLTLKAMVVAFLPGVWFLFSLSYARGSFSTFVKKEAWTLAALFLVPLCLVFLCRHYLFSAVVEYDAMGRKSLDLGWAGLALHACLLAGWVLSLINLERTIRASVGVMRWQIKYMILGLVTLFVARIYTSSQTVLFRSTSFSLDTIKGWALFIACLSIAYSYARTKPLKINVYPSQTVLSGSIVGLLTGAYLLIVAVFAKLVTLLGGDSAFPLKAFWVLISFFGLGVFLLSERFRNQIKHWVSRHFRRSLYDYRQLWMTFTEQTSSTVDEPALCRAVVKWVSETFNVLSVNIWLLDESKKQLRFGGSTSMAEIEAESLLQNNKLAPGTIETLCQQPQVVDLDKSEGDWAEALKKYHPGQFSRGGHRFCIRLMKGNELLGFFTLGDRVNGMPYSLEDFDFLKCVSDQIAASLHHLQLSQRLLNAKEMATFQTMSAFFVHDLKNTASTLSLMLQNLPVHFDDPNFRQDALRAIGKSAQRINELIERLSSLRPHTELKLVEICLNKLLATTVSALKPGCQCELVEDFQPLPKLRLDPEQIQKVATNLILNASEASGKGGRITVSTAQQNGWALFSVTDNGCGMDTTFINRSLFRPFQTTKKKGIGIGLFHTKMIVEAHQGRIEVESDVGKGTTFRVLLPLNSTRQPA